MSAEGFKSFEETRPSVKMGGEPKKVSFMLVRDERDPSHVTLIQGPLKVELYNTEPTDIDRKPYWHIYLTHWNNFAAYGDEKNTNKAYPLALYADTGVCKNETEYEEKALLLNDMVSSLIENVFKSYSDMRVSHVVFRKRGDVLPRGGCLSTYEKCFQRALKTPKRRVWEIL